MCKETVVDNISFTHMLKRYEDKTANVYSFIRTDEITRTHTHEYRFACVYVYYFVVASKRQ